MLADFTYAFAHNLPKRVFFLYAQNFQQSRQEYFAALRDPVNEERYLELSLQRAPKLSSLYFRKYRFLRGDPSRSAEALAALETARRLSPMNPKYKEVE